MFDVITIGSASRDVFMKSGEFEIKKDSDSPTGVQQCFPLGSKLEVKDISFLTGGGGTNTAVTFVRQGYKTGIISVVGNDFAGKEIKQELEKEGVRTKMLKLVDSAKTAYSIIFIAPDGERTIFSYKGEGQHLDIDLVNWNKLKAKWVYLDSLGGSYKFMEKAVKEAKKHGAKIAFNPGGKELSHGIEKMKPILENINLFICNQEEAALVSGRDFEKETEIFEFMDQVIDGIFVMTKGPLGCVASDGKHIYRAGVPDSPIVERTGAGDSFGSGFVSEYIRSEDVVKAIQFGTANSSSVVAQIGAKAGILEKGDWGPWPLIEVKIEK